MHLASENYKITHFRHIDKGHNSMCIELIFKKIAGQMQMIIINIFASFNAYKIFHIYFILIKNHEIGLWPWNFYMTPWGDFGGICFENAPDPKLALSKGLILLSEMSHQNLRLPRLYRTQDEINKTMIPKLWLVLTLW